MSAVSAILDNLAFSERICIYSWCVVAVGIKTQTLLHLRLNGFTLLKYDFPAFCQLLDEM